MKKTIAKIMAAAMVLSTITVPTAKAAATSPYVKNFTLTEEDGTIHKIIEDGAGKDAGTIEVAVTDDNLNYDTTVNMRTYTIDTGLDGSAEVVTEQAILENATFYAAYTGAMQTFVKNGTADVDTNTVMASGTTPSEVAEGGAVIVEGNEIIVPTKGTSFDTNNVAEEIDALETNIKSLKALAEDGKTANKAAAKAAIDTISAAYKTTVAGLTATTKNANDLYDSTGNLSFGKVTTSGAYLDVNVTSNDGVFAFYATDGSLKVQFPNSTKWINRVEDLNNQAIIIPLTVKSGLFGEIEGKFTLKLGGAITDDSSYWNAFVKLKASNNRYVPIRVHVDVTNGTYTNYGLYAEVLTNNSISWKNGNKVVYTVDNTIVSVGNLRDFRLQVQDVHSDDLALLRSDAAKGKTLDLTDAYIFDVTGSDVYYNWLTGGVYTDVATINVGKIQDIRSGLFKNAKEKKIQAKNVKWIRNGAFRSNKQLKTAILSDDSSMKKIHEKSFYKCKKLTKVKVNVKTLKAVGKNAFGDSTDKKSLTFNLKSGNKTKYNKAVKLFKKSGVKKAKFRKI